MKNIGFRRGVGGYGTQGVQSTGGYWDQERYLGLEGYERGVRGPLDTGGPWDLEGVQGTGATPVQTDYGIHTGHRRGTGN